MSGPSVMEWFEFITLWLRGEFEAVKVLTIGDC